MMRSKSNTEDGRVYYFVKRCNKCRLPKPLEAYHTRAAACKTCETLRGKARYAADKDGNRLKCKEWREANKDKRKGYRRANRAKIVADNRLR